MFALKQVVRRHIRAIIIGADVLIVLKHNIIKFYYTLLKCTKIAHPQRGQIQLQLRFVTILLDTNVHMTREAELSHIVLCSSNQVKGLTLNCDFGSY